MLGTAPRFPALETWQSMSESEQDALIGRLETRRRRRVLMRRVGLVLAGVAAATVLGAAFLAWSAGPP